MKSKDTFKRDNLIVSIIREHVGAENPIGGEELAKMLNDRGFPTKHNTIHSIISKLIKERYLPICSLGGRGYYFPKDKEDIEKAIEHLQARADELLVRVEFLKRFILK